MCSGEWHETIMRPYDFLHWRRNGLRADLSKIVFDGAFGRRMSDPWL